MNKNESGRTMMEMLGVLGIMGIIVYGAINGINSGMTSYKINQIYSDVSTAVRDIQDMYLFLGNDYSGITLEQLNANDILLKNPFGGALTVGSANGGKSFKITYSISNTDVCTRLRDMDWAQVSVKYRTNKSGNTCAASNAETKLSFSPQDK